MTPIFFVAKKIGVVVLLKYSVFFVAFLRKSIFKICLFWKKYLPLQVKICSICRTKYHKNVLLAEHIALKYVLFVERLCKNILYG